MRKRIVSLLLTLCMVLAIVPIPARAYSGDIPHVDYTRIEYNTVLETEVQFNIGKHTFTGKLANGNMLDEEEVDQIILEFMQSYNITTGDLQRLEALEDTALKYDESRYVQPRILAEYMLVVCGVKNAEQLSKLLTGEETIDPSKFKVPGTADVIKKLASMGLDKLKDFALGKLLGEQGKKFYELIENTSKIAQREYFEYLKSDGKAQRGFAAALALEKFYALCNARIKAKEREMGEGQWRLTCNQKIETTKNILGAAECPQYWTLIADLKQTTADPIDPNGWGGVYTGLLQVDVTHNLAAFDANFKDKVYLSSSLPFYKSASFFKITDTVAGPSTLKKRLSNPNFQVQLSYGGVNSSGQLKKAISFDGFEDLMSFWSAHKVRAGMDASLWNDGNWHFGGGGVTINHNAATIHNFYGGMADTWSINIEVDSWENINNYSISVPYNSSSGDYSQSGGGGVILTDHAVFEELLGKKEIVINNVD
ncbi:MAG: hypothetical protein IJE26_05365 [Oscillospiraceae bacterium]|nr:hypothetical protein [Oscillospiraceae bacterium]